MTRTGNRHRSSRRRGFTFRTFRDYLTVRGNRHVVRPRFSDRSVDDGRKPRIEKRGIYLANDAIFFIFMLISSIERLQLCCTTLTPFKYLLLWLIKASFILDLYVFDTLQIYVNSCFLWLIKSALIPDLYVMERIYRLYIVLVNNDINES